MLKKLFVSAILLIAILSFVVSLLKGNNNDEKTVSNHIADAVCRAEQRGAMLDGR